MGIDVEAIIGDVSDTPGVPEADAETETEQKPEEPKDKPSVGREMAPKGEDDEGDEEGKKKARKQKAEGAEEEEDAEVDEDEDKLPAEEPPKDTAKVKLKDGTEVTIDELKNGYMRFTDYHEKRRADSAKARELEQKQAAFEQEQKRFRRFWQDIKTKPEFMRDVFEEHAGDTFREAVRLMAEELYELEQMSPSERDKTQKLKEYERRVRKSEREREALLARQQYEQMSVHQQEMAAKYSEWVPAALKDAGVYVEGDKDHNEEVFKLLKARILSDYGGGDRTEDEIRAAAVAVAESRAGKALMMANGKADPADIEKVFGPEGVKRFLKYQADKIGGNHAPPAKPGDSKPAKKRKKKEGVGVGTFFQQLRDEDGI